MQKREDREHIGSWNTLERGAEPFSKRPVPDLRVVCVNCYVTPRIRSNLRERIRSIMEPAASVRGGEVDSGGKWSL